MENGPLSARSTARARNRTALEQMAARGCQPETGDVGGRKHQTNGSDQQGRCFEIPAGRSLREQSAPQWSDGITEDFHLDLCRLS